MRIEKTPGARVQASGVAYVAPDRVTFFENGDR